jgi:hypothetical protein
LTYIIESFSNFKRNVIGVIAPSDGEGDPFFCYFEEAGHGKNQHGDV